MKHASGAARAGGRRGWLIAALAMATGLGGPRPVGAQPADGGCAAVCRDEGPRVVTRGEARVKAAPDRAFLTLAAEAREPTPRAALEKNARAMQGVQQKLADAGVPKEALRTLAYELRQEFDFVGGKQVPRGYFARNAIEVRVDDVARLGELIDLGVAGGASSVGEIRFDLKDRETLERQALRLAVADARARADAAAGGAGGKVSRVLRIEESRSSGPEPRMFARAMAADVAAAPPVGTAIAPGEITIEASATLTAALE